MEKADIRSDILNLAQVIDYQAGSVVSREIVKGKTGGVTVFAFDEGEGLSEHTAPFDALVQVLDGEVEVMISGRLLRLEEGESVIMPADQPHSLKALKRFKMLLTLIKS
ncbi:MAG: cupin domain-containing protein [Actinobacteria bacterium]|nr:cupin domain-containing protein [Actinomycetota bacterium]